VTTQAQRMATYYASAVRAEPKAEKKAAAKAAPKAPATAKPAAPKVPKPTPQGLKGLLPADTRKKIVRQPGSGRKLANGFRVYTPMDRSQVLAALYSYPPAFKLMKRVLAYQPSFVSWGKSHYEKTFADMPAAARMNLVPKWALQEVNAYTRAVNDLAGEVASISAAEKVHAFDIFDEMFDAAFVGMSGRDINKMVRRREGGSLMSGVAKKINLVKRLRPWLARSHMPLLNQIGNELGKLSTFTSAVPYAAFYGAKPWKTGRSQNVMGVEVTSVGYKIATAVDDSGKPTSETQMIHDLASEAAYSHSAGDAGAYKAILARTPLGRVFLCQDPATKNLFLASDHAPRSKVWVQSEDSPFLKKLYRQSGNLNLFVF